MDVWNLLSLSIDKVNPGKKQKQCSVVSSQEQDTSSDIEQVQWDTSGTCR